MDYTKGLPFTALDRKVCAAMGAYFHSRENDAVALWQPIPSIWSHKTNPFARPTTPVAPNLHADMMIGEYEPVACVYTDAFLHSDSPRIRRLSSTWVELGLK